MSLFGSILGGVVGIGASIFGGASASRSMNKARSRIEDKMKENERWYKKEYYADPTQRADAQLVLTRLEDNIRQRNRAAAGRAAVMGSTEEAAAAEKAQNNKMVADTTAQIVAANEARKERVEEKYLNRKDNLEGQLNNIDLGKAQATSQAVSGVGSAVGGLLGSIL